MFRQEGGNNQKRFGLCLFYGGSFHNGGGNVKILNKKILKRYRLFIIMAAVNIILIIFFPDIGFNAVELSWKNLLQMLAVLPPIFILLGLLDVWVKRETMVKYMGEGSGTVGVIIAYMIGSAAAGPLYAAFPVAGVLLRKGSKLSNVFIMLGAWSTTKIPQILFEASALGSKFMLIRLALDIAGIAVIAFFTQLFLNNEDKEEIYKKAAAAE
jgi:uncharacterized membrane protein YraQ (UPF0718 family)